MIHKLLRSVVHNCVVHPLMPWADLCDLIGWHRAAAVLDQLHDATAPE